MVLKAFSYLFVSSLAENRGRRLARGRRQFEKLPLEVAVWRVGKVDVADSRVDAAAGIGR